MAWRMIPSEAFGRDFRWYEKKRPRELLGMLKNLNTYVGALQAGCKPMQVKYGFMHREPKGIVGIDQRGGGGSLTETRMYVYPEEGSEILHQIMIGDKHQQNQDIQTCVRYINELNEQQGATKPHVQGEGDERDHSSQEGLQQRHGDDRQSLGEQGVRKESA